MPKLEIRIFQCIEWGSSFSLQWVNGHSEDGNPKVGQHIPFGADDGLVCFFSQLRDFALKVSSIKLDDEEHLLKYYSQKLFI